MGNRLCWDAVSGKPSRSARCTLCEQSLLTRFGNDLIESWEKLEGPLGGGTLEERILREVPWEVHISHYTFRVLLCDSIYQSR